jgi:hypothetical protein
MKEGDIQFIGDTDSEGNYKELLTQPFATIPKVCKVNNKYRDS